MLIIHSIKFNFLLFALIAPICIRAMEQQESPFDAVSTEIKQHIMLMGISSCKDLQEVALLAAQIKLINTEWNNLIEDPVIVPPLVKSLHKKFNIKKLDVRYILHTKPALEKLKITMALLTKYAFLHHNALLQKNGGIKSLPAGTHLPLAALQFALQDLHQQRRNNVNFWNTVQNIEQEYNKVIEIDRIPVILDAYRDIDKGKITSAKLLYLSENIKEGLKIKLKSYLRDKKLLSSLYSWVFNVWYPDPISISSIGTTMEGRINPIVK